MQKRDSLITTIIIIISLCGMTVRAGDMTIDRSEYKERLRGFWLGSCIANWTGLTTENERTKPPFFTDKDWGLEKGRKKEALNFILNEDPWGADDDTDIEYVYQHAMEQYDTYLLTGEQISAEWQDHIGLPKLWVSNLAALGLMQNGVIPPETSLPENNPMWDMIDAQLTTEIFGALAPTRPDIALKMSHLPIRTTAYLHSEWASEFYVIMYSLAVNVNVDKSKLLKEQVIWIASQARKRIPDWSYIADMYDFVKSEYDKNPDKENWEATRDKVYERYQAKSTAGYMYKYPWDSGINFAASIVSLLYGEGDYKKTVRIGTLCGWDSDNPTATWGGLLGLLYGHKGLEKHFDKYDFSDKYWIERSRFNLPIPTDTFTDMAERGLGIIDKVVVDAMEGKISGNSWIIPVTGKGIRAAKTPETIVPWVTIEDSDPRWKYDGFKTANEKWNASGATLTYGKANCSAEFTFTGTAVQYFAFKDSGSGKVTVYLDGVKHGEYSLKSDVSSLGQHYVKIFSKTGLTKTRHTIKIKGDADNTQKTIDMLSIIAEN